MIKVCLIYFKPFNNIINRFSYYCIIFCCKIWHVSPFQNSIGGRDRIRTCKAFTPDGFQGRCHTILDHPSIFFCKYRSLHLGHRFNSSSKEAFLSIVNKYWSFGRSITHKHSPISIGLLCL